MAETVRFSIDLRHPDAATLIARGDAIADTIRGAVRNVDVAITEDFRALPAMFDAGVIAAVERAATAEGVRHRRMPSGAFHDAQFVVPIAPSGMIFVPCRNGVSHNPAEYSSPAQLAAGTRVLTRTLVELAA